MASEETYREFEKLYFAHSSGKTDSRDWMQAAKKLLSEAAEKGERGDLLPSELRLPEGFMR